ncbi:MAG: AMP-binding protein [Reyranellaceae bacterium]
MDQSMSRQTVPGLLAAAAARRPDAPAYIQGETVLSFAELDRLARRAASGLAALGIGRGDRVALWLPNVPAWPVLWLACCHLGAIAVAVNTRFRAVEVADIVARSGARILACWPGFKQIDFLGILGEIDAAALAGLDSVVVYGETPAAPPPAIARLRLIPYGNLLDAAPLEHSAASPDAPCNIFTTSGTTKAPKFVLHRQGAIAAHAARVARVFGFADGDTRGLLMLPFCGVYGFCQTTATWAAGAPLTVMELFDVERANALIDKQRITYLLGSDEMYDKMLAAKGGDVAFPSVRWAGYAGFNTSLLDIVERAERRGLTICGLYGMSEVQALYARQRIEAPAAERKQGGGHPVSPLSQVRVRDPETGKLLGHGEAGELELSGPSLMAEYFHNEDATRETMLPDGFIRTGDLGMTTGDGRFLFLTRMGDVLRLAGFLVSPAEIENHIQNFPGVEASQVVAVARPDGVRAVAFVVPRPGAGFDEAAIIAHCKAGLANYKVPAAVIAVEDFPRTPSANGAKIQRNRLRDMAAERLK